MRAAQPHKSSFGDASANIVAILCCLCVILSWTMGFVFVLAFYFAEKQSRLVKFYALQAALLWVVGYALGGGITFEAFTALITGDSAYMNNPLGWSAPLDILLYRLGINVLVLFLSIISIVYAYRWQCWRIPLLGHIAWIVVKNCPLECEDTGRASPVLQRSANVAQEHTQVLQRQIIRQFDTGGAGDVYLPPAAEQPPKAEEMIEIAVSMTESEQIALAATLADPGRQLPPEMRDTPLPGNINDTGIILGPKKSAKKRNKAEFQHTHEVWEVR